MKRVIFAVLAIFLLTGCGEVKKEKAAIKIGDIEITAKEFDDAFKSSQFASQGDARRREFLDTFIARKLILKEAERLGLDKDPEFLQRIQLFWEQALLKLALAQKIKELSITVDVDDSEIKNFYERRKDKDYPDKELSEVYDQIKWLLFRAKQTQIIQDWSSDLRNKAKIKIDYKLLGIEEDE